MDTTDKQENYSRQIEQGIKNITPHQFKPGQSGNPKGRPKGVSYLSDNYRMIMSRKINREQGKKLVEKIKDECFKVMLDGLIDEGLTFAGYVAFMQLHAAAKGNTAAATQIADRTEGRPSQELKHTGPGGGAILSANFNFDKMSTDKLERLESLLLEAREDVESSSSDAERITDRPE